MNQIRSVFFASKAIATLVINAAILIGIAAALIYTGIQHKLFPVANDAQVAFAKTVLGLKDGQGALSYLCQQRQACAAFSNARQACATAAHFNLCMQIKLSGVDAYAACPSDGVGDGLGTADPTAIQCFGTKVISIFSPSSKRSP